MSDDSNNTGETSGGTPAETSVSDGGVELHMRIPMIIVAVQAVLYVLALQAPTLIGAALGTMVAPALAAIFLAVWWMRSNIIPLKERFVVLAYFGFLLALVSAFEGGRMAIFMLPIFTTIAVVKLTLISNMQWMYRRLVVAAVLMLAAVVSLFLRIDAIDGDLQPMLSWRWEPVSEAIVSSGNWTTADLPASVTDSDWVEFRGAGRVNHVENVTFATDWDVNPPKELWRRRIGLGWASYSVVGNYIFTQEQRGAEEFVMCYRADTGEEVWGNPIEARFDESNGSGPRATPTYHDGKLYSQGATGVLRCLDASSGEVLWKRDLREDASVSVPTWGFASSPLIVDELVIVFAGGRDGKSVLAYNLESGEPVWSAGDGTHGYVSGVIKEIGGIPQLLMPSNIGIQAFVPETGELLWEHDWAINTNPRCVQPLVTDDQSVLIGTAGGKGTRLLQVINNGSRWNVEEEWTSKRFRPYFSDFVEYEGYLYGFDGSMFACIDAKTGVRAWKGKKLGGQVLLLPEMKMLLVLSEKGNVMLINATPTGYEVVSQFKALSGKTWNHPVIANGKLFVRNAEEAACFELPGFARTN